MEFNMTESFISQGFSATVQSVQRFNVLCVTKYSLDGRLYDFHLPTDGVRGSKAATVGIEVRQMNFTRDDISISQTIVTLNGKDYVLENIRNGLSGGALVIGIYKDDDERFGVWHLYTDTPSAKHDECEEAATSAQLHERAVRAMGWRPQSRLT